MRVLIVEDDADSALLLKMMVRRLIPADSSIDVVAKVDDLGQWQTERSGPLDWLLLDLMLTDGTGVDAWNSMNSVTPAAITVTSALDPSAANHLTSQLPPHSYLQKPLSATELGDVFFDHFHGASS